VWPLAIVPVTVACLVTAGTLGAVLHVALSAISSAFGAHVPALRVAAEIIVTLLLAPIAVVVGFGVAQPLSGPALNRIVRRVEGELGAPAWAPTNSIEDVLRALQSIAIAYSVALPILAILYAITFFVPAAAVVTVPLKIIVLALSAAWDLCDYPLSIHGVAVRVRVAFVARNLGAMIGFGFGLGLLSLVPGMMLLVLPAGVAGAARLTRQIELFEGTAG